MSGEERAELGRRVAWFKALRKELRELQYRLYSEHRKKLLIVLQAMDAGGKDGTIRSVMQGVDPSGCQVFSFKKVLMINPPVNLFNSVDILFVLCVICETHILAHISVSGEFERWVR